jgi:hypothetical protein
MTMTDQQYDALLETADRIIDAIRVQHPAWDSLPKVIDRGGYVEIVWEEGPFEWPFAFPHGGVNEDYGVPVSVPDVSEALANQGIEAGETFDCQTHYSLAVYRPAAQ